MNSRQLSRTWPYSRRGQFIKQVKQSASNWFLKNHYEVDPRYSYCLARWDDWHNNIIVPEVAEYIEGLRQEYISKDHPFPLHDYIHHGLSSQALLFNLIGPLIITKDIAPLQYALQSNGLNWPGDSNEISLEYEDRHIFNEDTGQPTSIDLVIGNPDLPGSLFIECKFVETGFGGCSVFGQGDCNGANPALNLSECYLHHIGRQYWSLLKKQDFLKGHLSSDSMCILANHYQYFREILFSLEKGGTFIILSDDRNPTFACKESNSNRSLVSFLLSFVPSQFQQQVGNVSIQNVVKAIEESHRHEWINKFKSKYGINDI